MSPKILAKMVTLDMKLDLLVFSLFVLIKFMKVEDYICIIYYF